MKRLILILSAICLGCQSASDYFQAGRNLEITFAEIEEISSKSGETTPEEKSEIAEELKINTVDLFIFNTAGKLENRTRYNSDIYLPKTVLVTTPGEKTIYAIANADGNINLENLPNNDALTASYIESLEIFHKNIHTSLPYVSKTKQKLDLSTTPKIELKFQRVHAKIEIINQSPGQLTVSSIEISGLPNSAYLFKTETPQNIEYNQKTTETTFYTFATETPIKIDLLADVNRTNKTIIKEFPRLVTSETNIINIAKVDNSEIKILNNDDWQGYQSSGIHHLGDISVVSEGAFFNTDGTLLTYSNTTEYTLNLSAPNYTLSDLTLKSNQVWLTISKATNPYKITIQKNDKEEERTAILSINKSNTSIKYLVVKQAKKPIIYFIQEPIKDNIKQKLADLLEMAGGAKSGVLTAEFSAHETMAPSAMDPKDGLTMTNEDLTAQTLKLNFAQIKAGQENKRTTTLKINRTGTTPGSASEVASITLTQTPHTLIVPDYTPFISTNAPAQSNPVTAKGATPDKTWTATAKDNWLTATKSENNLILQPTNNTSAARSTTVTLLYDGTTLEKTISQAAGYAFTLSTNDATITSDNLKAYSIAKTYTVTITSNVALDFSTVSATLSDQPTWSITQPKGTSAGTVTTGTFTITLPAATSTTTEPEATVTLKIGALTINTLKVTQAKKVTYSQATPYDIIGGETTKPVVTISSSSWDIASQTPTSTTGLTISTSQASSTFTINAASTLSYNTSKTTNTLTLKNDKGETISTYQVSQAPVTFTIATTSFTNLLAGGETRTTAVSTTNNLPWTANTPSYSPTTSTGWLTSSNSGNATLNLTIAKTSLTTTRSARLTLTSKGTTSQEISVSQKAYVAPPNTVKIGNQTWSNFNVGASPMTLVTALPSYDWDNSVGGYYNWTASKTACPTGYRLPSRGDYDTLLSNTNCAWPKNGVKVILKLTDKVAPANTLEFPAAGCRTSGTLVNESTYGYYLSSTETSIENAYYLLLGDGEGMTTRNPKAYEFSVRCLQIPSNEVVMGALIWLKYNVGATTLPSANWESSKGSYYNWTSSLRICPEGYRLPSISEYNNMLNYTDSRTLNNGTKLYMKRTDKVTPANTLEFPAAGSRKGGTLGSEGAVGAYWSSTEYSNTHAHPFAFDKYTTISYFNPKTDEYSVRCLHE